MPGGRMQCAARRGAPLMKALSNPDRLLILCRLSRGEACVGELGAALGIAQPNLSQQLSVLRRKGLVSTRREGRHIYYALASTQALAMIEALHLRF